MLVKNHITISTYESCTGGKLTSLFTEIEGSSNILKGVLWRILTILKVE